MVQTVNIIRGNAPPEDAVEERTIESTEFAVKVNGQLHQPAITAEVEMERADGTSSVSDQCGHTTRNKTTNNGWIIRVQGIITANDARPGNLSLALLRDVVAGMDDVQIRCDMISGRFVLSNVVITQPNDIVSVQTSDTFGEEQAFEFQLQLGEEETE